MITLGAVSYLNARPLIDGLDRVDGIVVRTEVPSRLLPLLESGASCAALCPVIDYQRSATPLRILPVGAIGSDGPTLTVRVFSRIPLAEVQTIHVDADSHTSVALLQVVFRSLYGHDPRLVPLDSSASVNGGPEAVLLIGDKVITAEPEHRLFGHQLDLGEAWKQLTGLPFVFATWMTTADAHLDSLPCQLEALRRINRGRLDEIIDAHAGPSGWTSDLAREYLRDVLCYEVGPRQLEAMQLFWSLCFELGIIGELRPLELYR